ncbi:hypothetical protein OG923_12825 [Streptomyces halstedii]|uniref:hypothetical protein n=1 Tax=Streptomyces halstedii TaxID=1944 RepID=UPI003252E5EC
MTATAPTPELAPRVRRGAVAQSVMDSLVVARRNLIRMIRIPNLVRSGGFQFNSPERHDLRLSAGMGGAQ